MYSLILYDTSNFIDFPIGGQLTSIRNFLKYLIEFNEDFCKKILLVGITNDINEVGKIKKIAIYDFEFSFLPVIYRDNNLSNVKKSMRLEYVKGLFKYLKNIKFSNNTINYIHTPEAIIPLKFIHPFSKYIIFSHGSYFNMVNGFRFYNNNKIILKLFNIFIIFALKNAKLIFTLDNDSTKRYLKYNKNIIQTDNSIVVDERICSRIKPHSPLRLLFVGRLSKVKCVDVIIDAVLDMDDVVLEIVGDGEELITLRNKSKKSKKIKFIGAVKPNEVGKYMKSSDILIMNSVIEGKPMTIIEALSYGLPVVTTNVGGIEDMVINHYDSEFTNGNKDEIINCVNTIKNKYGFYSNNALHNSKKYDYKVINKLIFDNIINKLEGE